MMAEYLEREEIIGELDELISNISFTSPYVDEIDRMIEGMERARDCVYNAETADVAPVRHGRWETVIDHDELWGDLEYYKCSVCGTMELRDAHPNYCPNCGANMRGE